MPTRQTLHTTEDAGRGDGVAGTTWRLGPWLVEPGANRITGPSGATQVEPKVMDVLVCLVERRGETVSVDRLLEQVWPGVVVEENALRRAVSQLRKAFDDDARNPRVIATIPKKGYRLIAPLHAADPGSPPEDFGPSGDATYPSSAAHLTLSAPGYAATRAQAPRRANRTGRVLGLFALALAVAVLAWVLRPDPADVAPLVKRPVTSLPGLETDAALSPDGQAVAFVWHGAQGDNADVYVQLLGADTPQRLTDDPAAEVSPTWAPDGRRVAFLRLSEDVCGLFVVPILGGGERKIDDCDARVAGALDWSSDGRWLAFPARPAPDASFRIVLLDPETRERRTLTTPATGTNDVDPVFAPDGQTLAFIRRSSGGEALFTVPVAGGPPTAVLTDFGDLAEHAWTPDGKRLFFSSDRGGNYRLWEVPATGGTPRWRADVGAYDPSTPSFAGPRMAYVEWDFEFNLWQLTRSDTAGASSELLIASSRWDLHPQFAPDGVHIAFTSNRSGTTELWTGNTDGAHLKRLTAFDGPFVSTPRWSPDGRHLVFDVRHEATADLYVIDADGGAPRRLTTHPADEVAPSWSRDGAWIYFGSPRSGRWEVWKMPSAGGEAVQVTTTGGYAAVEASDEPALYYTKSTARGLWRRSLDSDDETQVFDDLAPGDWGNWVLHGAGLYVVTRSNAGDGIAYHDFTTGTTTLLTAAPTPIPWNKASLTVSPDGRTLLYARTDRRESDIVLVENVY